MRILIPLFIGICLLPFCAHCQGVEPTTADPVSHLKMNSVFGNVGVMVPLFGGSASISYDRSMFITNDNTDIRGKISIGYMGIIGGYYNYQSLTGGLLTGKHHHHFEMFAGGALNQYYPGLLHGGPDSHQEESEWGLFPVGNIGCRYQKTDGWFIFRAGTGFPDLVYLGVGVAF